MTINLQREKKRIVQLVAKDDTLYRLFDDGSWDKYAGDDVMTTNPPTETVSDCYCPCHTREWKDIVYKINTMWFPEIIDYLSTCHPEKEKQTKKQEEYFYAKCDKGHIIMPGEKCECEDSK